MKIYTKTGDSGETSLIGGTRVPKYHLRIETYGTVDELNSYIGLIASQPVAQPYLVVLRAIQDRLFTIGSNLAADPTRSKMQIPDLKSEDILLLENQIDQYNETLPPLQHFILPGGTMPVSFCHIARCVCRRAERLAVALQHQDIVDKQIVTYLNRLSDYLFVLARKLSSDEKAEELVWKPKI